MTSFQIYWVNECVVTFLGSLDIQNKGILRYEDLCCTCYLIKWKERHLQLLKTYFLLILRKLICT